MLPAILSALHVLALGIGLGAVFVRGRALRALVGGRADSLPNVFLADGFWGLAAFLWATSGLARAFGGLEKSPGFYLFNGFFWVKMGLFATVLALEIYPMVTLMRWRYAVKRGTPVDTSRARLLIRLNDLETALVVLIPFVAAAMARRLWLLA